MCLPIQRVTYSVTTATQASVHHFFARPGAPRARHLHIEAALRPGGVANEVRQIWQQPPSLEWLTPALRSACSLRLTFAPELMFAVGGASLQARTVAALLFVCGALETLHFDLGWLFSLDQARWRDVLPPHALRHTSVRRLILETSYLISLPPRQGSDPLDAPELVDLEQLVLRSSEIQVSSLNAVSQHAPQRLTLEARSRISVPGGERAADVVQAAGELSAAGRRLELCCPARDCIGMYSVWDKNMPLKQQESELLETLRSCFVDTAHPCAD